MEVPRERRLSPGRLEDLVRAGKLPYTVLRDAVFSHPTLAESINNLFRAVDRESSSVTASAK